MAIILVILYFFYKKAIQWPKVKKSDQSINNALIHIVFKFHNIILKTEGVKKTDLPSFEILSDL